MIAKLGVALGSGLIISLLLVSCTDDNGKNNKESINMNKEHKVQSNEKTIEINTMLEVAYFGKPELIQRYLDHNHTIDQIDSRTNSTPLYYAIQANQVDTIQPFINHKANIEHQNNLGQTPLHMAASLGRIEIVSILLKNKANINAVDSNGLTPLIYAIKNKQTDVAKLLIEKGAILDGNNKFQ